MTNLTVVASNWEEALVEPANVVLSAHVIYWTADVVPFLDKLCSHARERCLIVLRATQSQAWWTPLGQELRGEAVVPQPTFLDLYNLLFQIGMRLSTQLFRTRSQGFRSLDEAADRVCRDLLENPNASERRRVHAYVTANLQYTDGVWVESNPTWVGLADIPSEPAM